MWDASEKHGVGLSSGNRYQLGDFDECVAVTKPIVAQYCLVEIFLKVPQEYNTEDPFARSYNPFISTWSKLYVSSILLCPTDTLTKQTIFFLSSVFQHRMKD